MGLEMINFPVNWKNATAFTPVSLQDHGHKEIIESITITKMIKLTMKET